jgi:hypothetical protein
MQDELISHMQACLAAYVAATGKSKSWIIARATGGDYNFFKRFADPDASFTVRKYDEVMRWFSDNWPENRQWPAGVPRPNAAAEIA